MVAVDIDGVNTSAVVSITFSTVCTQWPDAAIMVPRNASLEQIGQCSSIDTSMELRIDSNSDVRNLLALRNLQVRCEVVIWSTCNRNMLLGIRRLLCVVLLGHRDQWGDMVRVQPYCIVA